MNASKDPRSIYASGYCPRLFWLGLASLIWIGVLLYAGGFTTTIRAGMAFLDWPLSNGSINPDGWLTNVDMRAEHSHRLAGMVMGLLSIGLCVMAYAGRTTTLVRKLSAALVVLVIVQGVVGGLRVKLDTLNLDIDHNLYGQGFAVLHGILAQIFLCLLVSFVVASSRSWNERNAGFAQAPSHSLGNVGLIACGTIILQLVVGAVMRQAEAGLAIPTFPLTPHGTLIPLAFDFNVAVHFAHRVGAVLVTIAIVAFVVAVLRNPLARSAVGKPAYALIGALCFQIYLGALTIWTVKNPHAATFHMLNGALTLALCWSITLRCLKGRIETRSSVAAPSREAHTLSEPAKA